MNLSHLRQSQMESTNFSNASVKINEEDIVSEDIMAFFKFKIVKYRFS